MDALEIDGGHGEGGGQIVRSSVALSCITGKPIHLKNIRKGRRVAGLRPQHLAAISILQRISGAEVAGAETGSTELKFVPDAAGSMKMTEDVGTAGSIPLILQVLMPVAAASRSRLDLTIRGGTDVSWSPSMDYITHVLGKAYSRMGMMFSLEVRRRGYYPKGMGEVILHAFPSDLRPAAFSGKRTGRAEIICTFSKLPRETIQNEIRRIGKELSEFVLDVRVMEQAAADSGASVLVFDTGNRIAGVDSLFDKKAGRFGIDASRFAESLGVDENLADMLVLPASICDGRTTLQVKNITKHMETNLFVISKITGCRYGVGRLDDGFEVMIDGVSHSGVKQ